MNKKTERKERRKSLARARAEKFTSGYETEKLRVPDGVEFFKIKEGTMTIDIVSYIAGKGNDHAPQGVEYYERTFWCYNQIGPEQKYPVCPSKTFGHKDYIQEVLQKESRKDKPNKDLIKSLIPKQRQLFLVFDHDARDKGVQLWEFSYHMFGKLLDSRIKNSKEIQGWDLFYFSDMDGMNLQLTIENDPKFKLKVTAIDFIKREKSLPKEIVNHGICLDDLLIEPSYDELKSVFLGVDIEDLNNESDLEPVKSATVETTVKSDPIASDYGISKGDSVEYDGKNCAVMKISPDGTSLTLLDEQDDIIKDEQNDIIKAVSPSEVKLIVDSEGQEESPEEVIVMDDEKGEPKDNWDDDPAIWDDK